MAWEFPRQIRVICGWHHLHLRTQSIENLPSAKWSKSPPALRATRWSSERRKAIQTERASSGLRRLQYGCIERSCGRCPKPRRLRGCFGESPCADEAALFLRV